MNGGGCALARVGSSAFLRFAAIALCAVFVAGCGGESKVTFSGSVTVDGAKADRGVIIIESVDGQFRDELNVRDGLFSGPVRTGKKKLSFELRKVVGQEHVSGDPNNPLIEKTEPHDLDSSAPSTLEITSGAKRDFVLTAKK